MHTITHLFLLYILVCSSLSAVSLVADFDQNHLIDVVGAPDGEMTILTTGGDPQLVFTIPEGGSPTDGKYVLSFEYFAPDGIDNLEIFYGRANELPAAWSAGRLISGGPMPKSEAYQPFSVDLKSGSNAQWDFNWDALRLDLGQATGRQIRIRNLHLREPNERERMSAEELVAELNAKNVKAASIRSYLSRDYDKARFQTIEVEGDTIRIEAVVTGKLSPGVVIAEFKPHQESWVNPAADQIHLLEVVAVDTKYRWLKAVTEITAELPRYTEDGYDRRASRFAIVENQGTNEFELLTPARWVEGLRAAAARDMPRLRPSNLKGLGGVVFNNEVIKSDVVELGLTASTVNIKLDELFVVTDGAETIRFDFEGKTYEFNRAPLAIWDKTISELTEKGIVISAVLLISPNAGILNHPEYDPAGIFSMSNLTTADGAGAFRALMAFIAERYSRPDQEHGWISHWIVFNEIDYGWVWTNMGKQPIEVFFDHYYRSMRLVWIEVSKYNPTAEVFISLTHHWDYLHDNVYTNYPARALVNLLPSFTNLEGDFHWGIAYHPYPQSLLKQRTWEDNLPTSRFDTPYITMKNIEVLDAYVRQEKLLYKGSPRTILLSEQGYHTPDYEPATLRDQQAAIAYTWKKMEGLSTIESYHYHRWMDSAHEGGLYLGLRKLANGEQAIGSKKPGFDVFAAMETEDEAAVIEPLKEVIGIQEWEEIRLTPIPD